MVTTAACAGRDGNLSIGRFYHYHPGVGQSEREAGKVSDLKIR
jgi:hypothetical protein